MSRTRPKPVRCPTPATLGQALGGPLPKPGRRIGLLGGSFNPAHQGHRHIALEACKHLKLDEVWLLVSPQNPLKEAAGMAGLEARLASARQIAQHPRLRVTTLETALGTRVTADTLKALRCCFPGIDFVWLMGADNLAQVHRWGRWTEIFNTLPVAVLDRPSYSLSVLYAKAAQRFASARVAERRAATLPGRSAPAWTFLHIRLNPLSATALREGRGHLVDGTRTTNHGEAFAHASPRPDKE
ncbi:MAG: nicotinate-nucleotide adenylyltransferase [Pseudomonadota bacterium]